MTVVRTSLVLMGCSSLTAAQFVPVDFSSQFNMTRSSATLLNGLTMPSGPQVFTHGAEQVPVQMGGNADTAGLWAWSAFDAQPGSGTRELTVLTSLQGVTSVYTMMNSFWGNAGGPFLSVTFNATGGVSQSFSVFGNVDLRDYNQNPSYTNTINGTMTQQVFSNTSNQRLDMQRFDLDGAFANETMTSVVFTDTGNEGVQRVFLTGITAYVPAPGTAAVLFASLCAHARRRR